MKKNILSIVIAVSMLTSLIIPVHATPVASDYETDGLAVRRIEITDTGVTVKGTSDEDVTAVLVEPGKEYSDITTENINEIVSDVDCFEAEDGTFTVKFYEENTEDAGYTMYLSNGTAQLEFDIAEYSNAVKVYVSPDGNDANVGSKAAPLKTIGAAQALVRNMSRGAVPIDVIIDGGAYAWESLSFTAADSGAEGAEISYIAEGASFRGTQAINTTEFQVVTDSQILSRLPENAKGNVLYLDLEGTAFEDVNFIQDYTAGNSASPLGVYVNGVRQTLSRYPNEGFMKISSILEEETEEAGATILQYNEDNIVNWDGVTSAYGVGYFGAEYRDEWAKITEIDGTESSVSFESKMTYEPKINHRWYITNLIEEMDVPGEWYVEDNKLYYFPAENFADSTFELAYVNTPLITVNGANYVNFSGFNISGVRARGIDIKSGDNIKLENLDISHTKGEGIYVAGNNVLIDGCTIHNTYATGIYLDHIKNFYGLTESGTVISNNHIYKAGTDSSNNWAGGIYVHYDVGTEVKNNLIHSIKNYSITYRGVDNLFQYNEIWSGNRETADSVPFYSGRSWAQFGNKILNNYVHDSYNKDTTTTYRNYGITTGDDGLTGTTISNNIVVLGNGKSYGISAGVGYQTVTDNIVVGIGNLERGINLGDPGTGWSEANKSTLYTTLNQVLTANEYDNEKWAATVKEAYDLGEGEDFISKNIDANDSYRFIPHNTTITGNVSVKAQNVISSSAYTAGNGNTISDNTYYSQDIFSNYKNHDFTTSTSLGAGAQATIAAFSSIGIDGATTRPQSSFELTWPYDESTVAAKDLTLSWTEAEFADEYDVVVATDAGFSDVVYEGTTLYTNISPEDLEVGETYYWKVNAKNLSKQIGNTWDAEQASYSFTVAEGEIDASQSSYKITATDSITNKNTVAVNVNIVNYSDTAIAAGSKAYVSFYSDDALVAVKSLDVELGVGGTLNTTSTYTNVPAFDEIKLLLWDADQRPLIDTCLPRARQNMLGNQYEVTEYTLNNSSNWANLDEGKYTFWNSETATFRFDLDNAGNYDLYYYVPKVSLLTPATANVVITTGASGMEGTQQYTTTLDMSQDGYVYLGRYQLSDTDGTAYATITVSKTETGKVLLAHKMKAVEIH